MPPEEGTSPADAGTGAPAPGAAPAGAGQGTAPADAGHQSGSDDSAATIARINAEAKSWREKFETAQALVDEAEKAKMSETERLQAQLKEEQGKREAAERRAQETLLHSTVAAAAAKSGAVDPDLVVRALDLDDVKFDDKGQPEDVDKLIDALKAKHPVLFDSPTPRRRSGGSADQGARGGKQTTGDMNALIRQGARR